MRRKNINNQIIRESITEALLILMESLSFSDITISALTRKAGVSRVSFYRNYKSKEEVLVSMLEERSRRWWEDFKLSPSEDYIESFFEACLDFKGVAGLLKKQSLEHLLLTNIQNLVGPKPQDSPETAFKKACLSGGVYGVLMEWIKCDMRDTPKEISQILSSPNGMLLEFIASIDFSEEKNAENTI